MGQITTCWGWCSSAWQWTGYYMTVSSSLVHQCLSVGSDAMVILGGEKEKKIKKCKVYKLGSLSIPIIDPKICIIIFLLPSLRQTLIMLATVNIFDKVIEWTSQALKFFLVVVFNPDMSSVWQLQKRQSLKFGVLFLLCLLLLCLGSAGPWLRFFYRYFVYLLCITWSLE